MQGNKFYHIRWCLGYTQKQMAEDLKISTYVLKMYENDKKLIPYEVEMKMEKHLKKFKPWVNL